MDRDYINMVADRVEQIAVWRTGDSDDANTLTAAARMIREAAAAEPRPAWWGVMLNDGDVSHAYPTEAEAVEEAKRLAAKHSDRRFYVVAATHVVQATVSVEVKPVKEEQ